MFAIVFDRLKNVQSLLDNQADLNVRDYWQRTSWLLSIQVGDLEKVKLIFGSRINRDERDLGGKTVN